MGPRMWVRVRIVLAGLLSLVALIGMARVVLPATSAAGEPPGVRRQLAFLRDALDHGAGERAQGLFPEGYFFLTELYGLAWAELGRRDPDGAGVEALAQARWALARLDTPAGLAPFDRDLVPSYGVFYRGWTNWLRGGVLSLQQPERRDPDEMTRFDADSAALAAAFDASASPYLAAYPGQAWPVDSTVAIASLRLHDALRPARYGATIGRWLDGVRRRLDPVTGLMPHRVDLATGEPTEVARATSQSVIQRFLVDVDPDFARQQYLRFRDQFVSFPFSLGPAAKEYPGEMSGPSDVDSGPLPLGVSLSATVVTLGAAQVEGDSALAGALADYGELVGIPVDTPWTKRYVLGLAPIGDAFLVWSKTARPWVSAPPNPPYATVGGSWRVPLLMLLFVVGSFPWLPRLLRLARRRTRPWTRLRAPTGGDGSVGPMPAELVRSEN